jgi:hypothetical protein
MAKTGRTPLHAATDNPNPAALSTLLKYGFNGNTRSFKWYTPLREACLFNDGDSTLPPTLEHVR